MYNNNNNIFDNDDNIYNNNNVFNINNDNLDEMARAINNKKKKKVFVEAQNDYNDYKNNISEGLNKMYKTNEFYSLLPTPILSTANSESDDFDLDIVSSYSVLPKRSKKSIKKHLRLNTEHLKNYNDADDMLILEHMKKCSECKSKLLLLLKNDNHVSNKHDDIEFFKKSDKINFSINDDDLNSILISIMMGIAIIFIMRLIINCFI